MILAIGAMNVLADELNPSFQAPQGVIVREDNAGNKDVFKTNVEKIADEATATNAMTESVTPENVISNIKVGNELDLTTSDEQWHRWASAFLYATGYSPNYYTYNCYHVTNYYYPSYRWSYGSYSYTHYSHSYYNPYSYYHRW